MEQPSKILADLRCPLARLRTMPVVEPRVPATPVRASRDRQEARPAPVGQEIGSENYIG